MASLFAPFPGHQPHWPPGVPQTNLTSASQFSHDLDQCTSLTTPSPVYPLTCPVFFIALETLWNYIIYCLHIYCLSLPAVEGPHLAHYCVFSVWQCPVHGCTVDTWYINERIFLQEWHCNLVTGLLKGPLTSWYSKFLFNVIWMKEYCLEKLWVKEKERETFVSVRPHLKVAVILSDDPNKSMRCNLIYLYHFSIYYFIITYRFLIL